MRRAALFVLALAACDGDLGAPNPAPYTLSRGGFSAAVSPNGDVLDVRDPDGRSWRPPTGDRLVRVAIDGGVPVACDAPSSVTFDGEAVAVDCDLRPVVPVVVRTTTSLVDAAGAVALSRVVRVTPTEPPLLADLAVSVGDALRPPGAGVTLFVPHQDGVGEEAPSSARPLLYALAGRGLEDGERLAVPMISEADADGRRLTRVTDPTFSASFVPGDHVGWTYTGHDVPMTAPESRAVFDVFHAGPPDAALDALYATALSDVPPGPAWLHDIAWQHYDYMSHGGQGWFDDIDALAAVVAPEDRPRVLFTLHGWFDVYGHYAYDAGSKRLLDAWTVFPNAAAVAAQFPGSQTIPMTRAEVHRRIAYAKSRGFRVAFYFADGMATGEDVAGVFAPDRVLYRGGWQGPDTTSPTWTLNPAHPDVARFFREYLDALLAEYGAEVDAFVWDETFHVHVGMVGPPAAPGYADRAMMLLTRDLARRVTAFRADLAFLASDDIGVSTGAGPELDFAPYALVAHGTYQDSKSDPAAWRYGLFPNLRNTMWSCNWASETHFDWTRVGVESVAAPVATSNGFGDDLGIAALDAPSRARLLALFAERKALGAQRLRWRASE